MAVAALSPEQRQAAARLWSAGVIHPWKLDPAQKLLHAEILAKRGQERMVALCSRGWGKTFTGLLMCIEACLQKPNQYVAFVTKTKRQAVGNIRMSAETILEDCPRSVRPTYLKNDAEFVFKNGSVLSLLGVDAERYDVIRGRALHGCFIDESQDIDELDKIVKSVLDPIVLRVNGWMVLAGTVPEDGMHDFVQFVREAQGAGHCIIKTILECPRYDDAWRAKAMARAGGADSAYWRREYMCEMVFSDTRQVIPEWTHERAHGHAETPGLIREQQRPEYSERYVGLDFGFSRDLTIALFGFYDFANASIVIEDELIMRGCTTGVLSEAIIAKELELWGAHRNSAHRFADSNEARTIYEMKMVHKLRFLATEKHAKLMHINQLRMLVSERRLIVHPRCKTLVKTLFAACWDKKHKSYERDEEIGHADALDALLYLVRNVKWNRNPVPETEHWSGLTDVLRPKAAPSAVKTLRACFDGGAAAKPAARTRQPIVARRRF